ncbi:MAG: hypothetical protein HKN82_09515 [Akkermansiaceae bacterium]|nr:hypothetical protein [Akkermansiaceae bacterium]NNM29122.1 hypothetical protein [Akkermansiaceae bacterium]
MKAIHKLLALAAVMALGSAAWAPAQEGGGNSVALNYQLGLDALKDGNANLARQCFEAVLQTQPNHANARYHLLNLRNRGPELAAKARKLQMEKIKIPKVDFRDSTLPEALGALAAIIDKQTDGGFAPNFIVQDPAGAFEKRPVTMTLNQVPASVVFDYILNLANASARYDEHAIVVKPIGGGGEPKKPAAEPAEEPSGE